MLLFAAVLSVVSLLLLIRVAWRIQKEGNYPFLPMLWLAIALLASVAGVLFFLKGNADGGEIYNSLVLLMTIIAGVSIFAAALSAYAVHWSGRDTIQPPFRSP